MIGEAALEIRAAEDGQLRVALADSDKVLVITVLARDAKAWADSVALLVRLKVPSKTLPKEWTAILEEPGLRSGSLSLTRRDSASGTQWSLFLADRDFEELRIDIDAGDVRALLSAMQRRANAARQQPAVRLRKPTRRPSGARNPHEP